MAKKKKYRVLTEKVTDKFDGKKWTHITRTRKVRLMAQAEGYAMVRLPGCMPFCVPSILLSDDVPATQGDKHESN